MRERAQGRRYRTWRQLTADFELLCANALAYNQRRSAVRSAASALLRTGRTLLQVDGGFLSESMLNAEP